MSEPKIKSENFQNFGGINEKISPQDLSLLEFLDIRNMGFSKPGALTARHGSTMYLGQTYPGQINSMSEFARLDGSSYIVQSYSGGIYFGATTGNAQGMSLSNQAISTQLWSAVPVIHGQSLINAIVGPRVVMSALGVNFQGITTNLLYGVGDIGPSYTNVGMTFFFDVASNQSDNILSVVSFQNYMFAADGNKFFKFDGSTTYAVGLPPVLWTQGLSSNINNNGQFRFYGITLSDDTGSLGYTGLGFGMGPSFGTYYLYASYVNNRGFEGPIWPLVALVGDIQLDANHQVNNLGSSAGFSYMIYATMTVATPQSYGISAVNIYCYYDLYNAGIGQTYIISAWGNQSGNNFGSNIQNRFWNLQTPVLMQKIPASGSTTTTFACGVSYTSISSLQANTIGALESSIPNSYFPLGVTYVGSTQLTNQMSYMRTTQFFPRYLEVYQNRLFLAGFSSSPSTVWFSDTGEPEGYQPSFNFDVRTNDNDTLTAMKAYSTRLYLFKLKSFHILSGDNPNNFFLQQASGDYGCLNNRCAVIFNDTLVFLSLKGVMLWTGANLDVLSNKIQPTIDSINWPQAIKTACAVHDKINNQVMFAVPVNGSTTNNLIIVYDYMSNAWTKFDGLPVSSLAAMIGRNNNISAFYGSYSGTINYFGTSFFADNGVGFSAYFKTRFLHDMGDTTQKQFRRLFLNINPPSSGQTLTFLTNFMQDYGTSVVLGQTIVQSTFQSRTEFGISAKSLAFEMSSLQTAIRLQVQGFTIESRMQRRV